MEYSFRNCSNFTRIRIRLLLEYQNNQIEWGSKMYMNIEYIMYNFMIRNFSQVDRPFYHHHHSTKYQEKWGGGISYRLPPMSATGGAIAPPPCPPGSAAHVPSTDKVCSALWYININLFIGRRHEYTGGFLHEVSATDT